MSGPFHGKSARLYIAGYDVSPLASAEKATTKVPMARYGVQDGSDGSHCLGGLPESVLDLSGIFDDNYMDIFKTMFEAAPGTGYHLMLPYGITLGDPVRCTDGVKLADGANWDAIITDVNKLTAQLVASGRPFEECILLGPKTQYTADGQGSGHNNGGASANGLTAYLQVFEVGGGGAKTLTVKVQMDDNAGFLSPTDLITFTGATGITTERKTAAGAVEQYLRVAASFAGGAPYTGTFAVAVRRT